MEKRAGLGTQQCTYKDQWVAKGRNVTEFTIFDYISAQNDQFVKVQNPRRRKQAKRILSEQKPIEESAPFPVLDFAEYSKTPCQFETREIDTSQWNEGDFEKQMSTVFHAYPSYWLDSAHTRGIVYPTDKMEPKAAFPAWKDTAIVFEKKENSVGMLYNSLYVLTTADLVSHIDRDGDPDLLRIVCRLRRHIHEEIDYLKNLPKPKIRQNHNYRRRRKVVLDIPLTWSDYQQGIHAISLTDQITPLEYPPASESEVAPVSVESKESGPLRECSDCSTVEDLIEMKNCWSCRPCLKNKVMHQVKMLHVPLELNFPNIEGICELDFISSILPVTLVRCYVKQALIPYHKKNTAVLQCPQCGSLSKEVEPSDTPYNAANCWHCKCVWCTKCALEPHWPLNCEEHKKWKIKWDKQYLCRNPRKDISEASNLLWVRCACSGENWVIDDWTHANCVGCRKPFNPSTVWENKGDETGKAFRNMFSSKKRVQVLICSKYSKFCVEARNRRLNEDAQSSFRAKCAKLRVLAPNSKELPELRMAVLHLVEYGMALLYQHRDQPKGLRRKLKRMHDLLLDVEDIIFREQWSDDSTLQFRILDLKRIFTEVVNLFKLWQ